MHSSFAHPLWPLVCMFVCICESPFVHFRVFCVYIVQGVQARSPKGNTAAATEMSLSEHELNVCGQAALEKTAALRSHQ